MSGNSRKSVTLPKVTVTDTNQVTVVVIEDKCDPLLEEEEEVLPSSNPKKEEFTIINIEPECEEQQHEKNATNEDKSGERMLEESPLVGGGDDNTLTTTDGADQNHNNIVTSKNTNEIPLPPEKRKDTRGNPASQQRLSKTTGIGTGNGFNHFTSKFLRLSGADQHLFMKLPKGFRHFQFFVLLVLAFECLLVSFSLMMGWDLGDISIAHQQYGVTLFVLVCLLALIMQLDIKDKGLARAQILTEMIYFALMFFVDMLNLVLLHSCLVKGIMMVMHFLLTLVSGAYWILIGPRNSGDRPLAIQNRWI